MSTRQLVWTAIAFLLLISASPAQEEEGDHRPVLLVCADPNNLPYSNDRGEGFENHLAEMIADDLGMRLEYYWHPENRGYISHSLAVGACDVVMSVPSETDSALVSLPLYRSSYVFVYRADSGLDLTSLDDPRLHHLRIGLPLIGDDGFNTPAAQALGHRGIVDNVVGTMIYGDPESKDPQRQLVDAVANGDVDVAILWGPLAGYYAQREDVPLVIEPVHPAFDPPDMFFVFSISVGVRLGDDALIESIDDVLVRNHDEVEALVRTFGIPTI